MSKQRNAPAQLDSREAPSIRRRLGALLIMLGSLVGGLLAVATLQLRASDVQAKAENQRNRSFRLADNMRMSSNDLTQMVRLYVATGEPRYRSYYEEILAIRSGSAPRPKRYDSSFWDRVLAEGNGFVEYGAPESLVEQMRKANFAENEFNALNASLLASDNLARLELEVMDWVAPRIAGSMARTSRTSAPSTSGSTTSRTCVKSASSWPPSATSSPASRRARSKQSSEPARPAAPSR